MDIEKPKQEIKEAGFEKERQTLEQYLSEKLGAEIQPIIDKKTEEQLISSDLGALKHFTKIGAENFSLILSENRQINYDGLDDMIRKYYENLGFTTIDREHFEKKGEKALTINTTIISNKIMVSVLDVTGIAKRYWEKE